MALYSDGKEIKALEKITRTEIDRLLPLKRAILDIEKLSLEREKVKDFIRDTIGVGTEYMSGDGKQFGVFLREMSGRGPYRIQWYDEQGLSGHSEASTVDYAVNLLLSDLGYDLQLAPGSMNKLFEKWEPLKQAIRLLADDPKIVPIGECFSYANRFVKDKDIPMEEWDEVTIVHGIAHNKWPDPGEREWYEHAWVEYKGKAYDWQTSWREPLTVEEFYEFYEPKDMKRYTVEEATIQALRSGHHGPWE